ncbi:hypothetical protein [Saccharothrix sp. ST-888]|uniref:hypothetical protein n=1 Tax=Saccharothrix sp. ST-888 TaxID=1427391 RepID=UPI0005ECD6D5|nr:hypothetical protein [Saccharothrix sp. ST-888]KJK56113.1 hypothetical protein UK12_24545 [Saccharothrix sp. ST-888]
MYLNKLPDAILRVLDSQEEPQRWNDVRTVVEHDAPHQSRQFYDVVHKFNRDGLVGFIVDPDDTYQLSNPVLRLTEAGARYTEEQRKVRRELVAANEAEWDTAFSWTPLVVVDKQYRDAYTEIVLRFHGGHMMTDSGSCSHAVWKRGERLMRLHFPEGQLRDIWGWSHKIDPDESDVLDAAALWGPVGMVKYSNR